MPTHRSVKLLGVFYDDPSTVPGARCRSSVGYVFKQGAELANPTGASAAVLLAVSNTRRGMLLLGITTTACSYGQGVCIAPGIAG
jgi:hypothetical protein